jgi:hypothetical protein
MRGFSAGFALKAFSLALLVYIPALLGPALICRYLIFWFLAREVWWFMLGVIMIVADISLLLLLAVLFPGVAARVFRLRYSGEHNLDLKDKDFQKWALTQIIYQPVAMILDLLQLYPLKSLHVKLFGARLGRGVVMGGLVTDPALFEAGDYSVIGGYSTILCHAVEHGKIKFGRVRIGKNCGVGTRACVLAGALIEDEGMLGAQSLLPKNAVIPQGKTYGGVPAREIKPKEKGEKNE